MIRFFAGLVIALCSFTAHAERWIPLAKNPPNGVLQFNVDSVAYSGDPATQTVAILAEFRWVELVKAPMVQTFWIDPATCDTRGGKIVGIMAKGTAPQLFIWNASGTRGIDVIGTTLCEVHERIVKKFKEDSIKKMPGIPAAVKPAYI